MPQVYDYNQVHFPQGFDIRRFARQFRDDATLGPMTYQMTLEVNGLSFDLRVAFPSELTAPQEAALAGVVASHDPSAPLLPGRTVAQLDAMQPGQRAGRTAWARDGRKVGEAAGTGTGVLAYSDGSAWRSTDGGPLQA